MIAQCATFFFLPHFDVIDLWFVAEQMQHGMYLLIIAFLAQNQLEVLIIGADQENLGTASRVTMSSIQNPYFQISPT